MYASISIIIVYLEKLNNISFVGYKYSWLSLSRPRLSRIIAHLKVKIWSLPKHENLTTGKKVLWKRGEIAPANFICRGTDISMYFRESLAIRDSESRLYIGWQRIKTNIIASFCYFNHLLYISKNNFNYLFIHLLPRDPLHDLVSTPLSFSAVDFRYLKVHGNILNTSRYPYLYISDLLNWGKYKTNDHIS